MESAFSTIITSNIDVTIVFTLMMCGAIIKHYITKIDNKYIPCILMIMGVVIAIFVNVPFELTVQNVGSILLTGVSSGLAATVFHSKGKDIINDLFLTDSFEDSIGDAMNDKIQKSTEDAVLQKMKEDEMNNVDE